jgi:hypothetical protein
MYIYLDEAGDLGFHGGGTDFFTIAFICLDDPLPLKRCIKKTKVKWKIPRNVELKGSTTQDVIKTDLLKGLARLDIEIHAITARKGNVLPRLHDDSNILYNYLLGIVMVPRILAEPSGATVNVQLDRRITSVTSGFKIGEYLKYKIWYENKRTDIDLNINHLDSHHAYAIQGIDVICNSIFKKYQWGDTMLFNIIRGKIKVDEKWFFSGPKK